MMANSKILLYGLGKTNLALYNQLHQTHSVWVGSDYSEELASIEESARWNFDSQQLSDFDVVFVTPGIKPSHPIFQHPEILNELDFSLPLLGRTAKVIGITGTNGKSSLCKFIADFLSAQGFRAAIVGNYGLPGCSILDKSWDYIIVELSSFQLFSMRQRTLDQALITGFEPDHLDWHPNLQHYRESKFRIQKLLRSGRIWIPEDLQNYFTECQIYVEAKHTDVEIAPQTEIPSQYSLLRVQAASILNDMGFDCSDLDDFKFEPLPHRQERLLTASGLNCINDSKATTPGATYYALSQCGGKRINLIVGGKLKGLSVANFVQGLRPFSSLLEKVFVYGELAENSEPFDDLDSEVICRKGWIELLKQLEQHKPWGDLLLLSPGCSSLDQFTNFEERGQSFKDFVLRQ